MNQVLSAEKCLLLASENDQLKLRVRQLEAECESLRIQLADEQAERALYSRLRGETTFEEMLRWEEELRNFKPGDGISLEEMLASLESGETTKEP